MFGQSENTAPLLMRIMRKPGARPRPGAHNSSGMRPDKVWHVHDLHQVLYAFDGAVEIESANARLLVPPQLAAWIPAGVVHRTRIQARRSGSVFLPPAMMKTAGDRVRILRVSPLLREMVLEAMRWPIDQPVDATGRIYFQTFARLCGEWIEDEAPLSLPTADEPRLKRAMDYTQAHLADARLGDVCRAANLSERSLRRRFTKTLGMTWVEYRRRCRLMKAMILLGARSHAISTVAALVGFESVSAFSRAYTAFVGESPRHYRNRIGR